MPSLPDSNDSANNRSADCPRPVKPAFFGVNIYRRSQSGQAEYIVYIEAFHSLASSDWQMISWRKMYDSYSKLVANQEGSSVGIMNKQIIRKSAKHFGELYAGQHTA
jgi:hypothetical protein